MTAHGRQALLALPAVLLAFAASALAKPLAGKTYEGAAPSSGTATRGHHQVRLFAGGTIILKVTRNGRSVSVRFSSSTPVLYCRPEQTLHVQSTKPARISGSGSFKASISERFAAGPGPPAIVQVVSGTFSGRSVRGTITTRAAECSGATNFSASAH
jgi:hypothetical protein